MKTNSTVFYLYMGGMLINSRLLSFSQIATSRSVVGFQLIYFVTLEYIRCNWTTNLFPVYVLKQISWSKHFLMEI